MEVVVACFRTLPKRLSGEVEELTKISSQVTQSVCRYSKHKPSEYEPGMLLSTVQFLDVATEQRVRGGEEKSSGNWNSRRSGFCKLQPN
jgi:hypothetical protein